jgi:hypothetical protein
MALCVRPDDGEDGGESLLHTRFLGGSGCGHNRSRRYARTSRMLRSFPRKIRGTATLDLSNGRSRFRWRHQRQRLPVQRGQRDATCPIKEIISWRFQRSGSLLAVQQTLCVKRKRRKMPENFKGCPGTPGMSLQNEAGTSVSIWWAPKPIAPVRPQSTAQTSSLLEISRCCRIFPLPDQSQMPGKQRLTPALTRGRRRNGAESPSYRAAPSTRNTAPET